LFGLRIRTGVVDRLVRAEPVYCLSPFFRRLPTVATVAGLPHLVSHDAQTPSRVRRTNLVFGSAKRRLAASSLQIVDVDDGVAHTLLSTERWSSFADLIGAPALADRVVLNGVTVVLYPSLREAASAKLPEVCLSHQKNLARVRSPRLPKHVVDRGGNIRPIGRAPQGSRAETLRTLSRKNTTHSRGACGFIASSLSRNGTASCAVAT